MRVERTNRRKGSALVELSIAFICLVPIILYTLSFVLVICFAPTTELLAQCACRMAASGSPADLNQAHVDRLVNRAEEPFRRASSYLSHCRLPCLSVEPNIEIRETLSDPIPMQPAGGPVRGWVKVKISTVLHLPYQLPAVPSKIQIKASHTMPYTWTMPPADVDNPGLLSKLPPKVEPAP